MPQTMPSVRKFCQSLIRCLTGIAFALANIVLNVAMIASIVLSPTAFAVQVQLQQGLRFDTLSDDMTGDKSVLAAGSVVDVPEEYRVLDNRGQVSPELTLMNWLHTAGHTGMKATDREGGLLANNSTSTDFFYPVKIVSAAPGSHLLNYKGGVYFLALRMLKQQQNQLVTRQPAPISPATGPLPHSRPGAGSGSEIEAAPGCAGGQCRQRSSSPAFDRLVYDLSPVLKKVDQHAQKTKARTADDFGHISKEFRKSCGFSLESFIPVVKQYCDDDNVPSEVMLSIMVQESSGHCFATGFNRLSSTHDSGLFGINSATGRTRRCSGDEIDRLRRMRPDELERGPHCVENPVLNLKMAISILKSKMENLTNSAVVGGRDVSGFDERQLRNREGNYSREAWRLAVSAYNGGERWVMDAKADLDSFNARYGTHLSPYNWEDLRVFYLRRFLGDSNEQHYFAILHKGRTSSAIDNLAYSENIVPRNAANGGQVASVAELWHGYDQQ